MLRTTFSRFSSSTLHLGLTTLSAAALDIGGSTAKCALFVPQGTRLVPDDKLDTSSAVPSSFSLPASCTVEDAHPSIQNLVRSARGESDMELKFVKCPTSSVLQLIEQFSPIASTKKKQQPRLFDLFTTTTQQQVDSVTLPATGGGAYQFSSQAKTNSAVHLDHRKEMDCVVNGLGLMMQHAPQSIFFRYNVAKDEIVEPNFRAQRYTSTSSASSSATSAAAALERTFDPFLLVNIGSGISFLKVTPSENDAREASFERVGGSHIGGACFWGLLRSITNITSWSQLHEVLEVSGPGDNRRVDLLVGDIYGRERELLGDVLPSNLDLDTLAASFGKVGSSGGARIDREIRARVMDSESATEAKGRNGGDDQEEDGVIRSVDVARSLLLMMSFNITQLSQLYAEREGLSNVIFCGGFVVHNPIVWRSMEIALRFWSQGEMTAHFAHQAEFVGVVGALLSR